MVSKSSLKNPYSTTLLTKFGIIVLLAIISLNLTAQYKSTAFTLKSAKTDLISVNALINKSGPLNPFIQPKPISGLSISANLTLNSDSSLVRVLLVDENYKEYLVYETYPMLADSNSFSIINIGEETAELNNIIPIEIMFEIVDASIFLKDIFIGKDFNVTKAMSISQLREQEIEKINKINDNIKKRGERWIAGETSVSKMTYQEKRKFFGGKVPNLQGFEYYKGGVFVFSRQSPEALSKSTFNVSTVTSSSESSIASEFSWRNRHGQDWMTMVKNQGGCGCCWAFGAVGATELLVNLYFNRHIDVDLSEQQLLSCANSGDCNGGYVSEALNFIKSNGIVNDDCFSYTENAETCANICANPLEKIKISESHQVWCSPETDVISLKKAIIKGPVVYTIQLWQHAMTLAGYKTIKAGDIVYATSSQTIIVPEGDPLLGQTAWLMKNSWGTGWGDNGYAYIISNIPYGTLNYEVIGPIFSQIHNDSYILCVDNDGDGYYVWGIGPKPAHCPPCPDQPDGDDTNACIGPMDENGIYHSVTPIPETSDVIVKVGESVTNLTAIGNNIRWYKDKLRTELITSDNFLSTGITALGRYKYYVTQTIGTCESDAAEVQLIIYMDVESPEVNDITACVGQQIQIAAQGENIRWYYDTNTPIIDHRDGQTYKIAKIGNQLWMAENLNYYTTGSMYYNFDSLEYSDLYGRQYNWEMANMVCPNEWQLPSESDYDTLIEFCGGRDIAGNMLKEAGISHWMKSTGSTDDFNFTALPAGMSYAAGNSANIGQTAYFWSSTSKDGDYPDALEIQFEADLPIANKDIFHKNIYLSVRCINKLTPLILTGNEFSNIFLKPGKYTYLVTQTISDIESPADTVIITVNSYNEPPKCNDAIAAYGQSIPYLYAEGMNIKWYSGLELTNLIGSGNAFNTGKTEPGSYEFYVTQTNGCESDPVKVTLTILIPAPSAEGKSICFGDIVPELTASGDNIRWYSDSDLTNLVYSGNSYSTNKTQPGIYKYYITQTIKGYQSPSTEVCLTIKAAPSSPSANNLSVCQNSPMPELSASGNNIKWYNDDNLSILLHTGSTYTTGKTQPGVYTYYTTQTVNECQSPATEVNLTIKAVPSSPTAIDKSVCQNLIIPELSASGTNIRWYGDANLSTPLHTGSIYATGKTQAGVYRYYVTQTINECQSVGLAVNLTINETPVLFLGNDISIYQKEILKLNANEGFKIYQWFNGAFSSSIELRGDQLEPGKNDIWLKVTDNKDCSAADTIIVTVLMETGVNTVEASEIVQIFPNPNIGSLNIRFLNKEIYNTQITLLNLNGEVMIQKKLEQIQENEIITLDLSSLPNGTYLVHIITDGISLYNKVIRID